MWAAALDAFLHPSRDRFANGDQDLGNPVLITWDVNLNLIPVVYKRNDEGYGHVLVEAWNAAGTCL